MTSEQLVRTVPATGSMYPWQEVIIGAEVGGYRVAQVLVDVGSHVEKDQPLVRLATDMLEADLASKRAALRSAQAGETNAAAALRRGESVSTSGALSAADLDRLKADQIAAQARVDTAASDLGTSELRLRYGTVRAPDAGTITSRTVSVGQIVQAGTEMLRMLRQDRVEWRAEVPEAQLARIKAGQTVEVTGVDGSTLKGRVRTVAPTVQTTNRTGLGVRGHHRRQCAPRHVRARRDRRRQGPRPAGAGGQRGDAGRLQLRVRAEEQERGGAPPRAAGRRAWRAAGDLRRAQPPARSSR